MITIDNSIKVIPNPHKVYPEHIVVQLKARHFLNTFYNDRVNCEICKSLREKFIGVYINENSNETQIGDELYYHPEYTQSMFKSDKKLAGQFDYNNTIIRTIILTKSI